MVGKYGNNTNYKNQSNVDLTFEIDIEYKHLYEWYDQRKQAYIPRKSIQFFWELFKYPKATDTHIQFTYTKVSTKTRPMGFDDKMP